MFAQIWGFIAGLIPCLSPQGSRSVRWDQYRRKSVVRYACKMHAPRLFGHWQMHLGVEMSPSNLVYQFFKTLKHERIFEQIRVPEDLSVSKNEIMSTSAASLLPILNEQTSTEQSGCSTSHEPSMLVSRRLPPWLRQNLGEGGGHGETAGLILSLIHI